MIDPETVRPSRRSVPERTYSSQGGPLGYAITEAKGLTRWFLPTAEKRGGNVMRYELSVTLLSILSIALGATPICAGEPHAYLIALANDVTLPKDIGVKMDLAPDVLSYSLRTKSYPIDSRLRNAYPLEMKEVIGPSENGFIVRISVGPKGNLPMARHDGIYTARTIARPYWTERVYGYETPQGSLAILVQQGSKVDIKLLRRVENLINKRSSKWRSKE